MHREIVNFIKTEILGEDLSYDLSPEDDLLSSGLISSMAMFRVLNFLEKKYEIKVPPQDMVIENFMSVNAMVTYASGVNK